MFEKFSRKAERMASGLSRRQLFGRLGRTALGAVGVLAGLGVIAGNAEAGNGNVCSPDSPNGCAGKPHGSPCQYQPGKCWSSPRQYDSQGRIICNVCREKKTKD
jgi:hypothetical protein